MAGLLCPKCGGANRVAQTFTGDGEKRRTRQCKACKFRFVTIERVRGQTATTSIRDMLNDPVASLPSVQAGVTISNEVKP